MKCSVCSDIFSTVVLDGAVECKETLVNLGQNLEYDLIACAVRE